MSAPELKISTANDVPAILHDGPDGVPQSGHSVSKERLSLSTREMNDQKDKVNDNDNDEACDTSTGAGTGDDRDREACNAGTGAEAGDDRDNEALAKATGEMRVWLRL